MKGQILSGTAEEWGLPPARLEALDAELADHAACLEERGEPGAVDEMKARANSGKGRRRLTGPHLTEQVAATLARWPSRSEWRELYWLLAWFAVILASDLVAFYAQGAIRADGFNGWGGTEGLATPAVAGWVTAAWLLQAIARAGFYVSFTVALVRAWQAGKGVLLARILQLKLIHTVLVVGAMWALSDALGQLIMDWTGGGWVGFDYIRVNWPQWLTAPYLLGYGLVIALALLFIRRQHYWSLSLEIVLCTLFLYPAAPVESKIIEDKIPILATPVRDVDGELLYCVPNDDPQAIESKVNSMLARGMSERIMDAKHNTLTLQGHSVPFVPGTIQGRKINDRPYPVPPEYRERYTSQVVDHVSYLPLFSPHAALAWLAAPIPILGFVGLIGMLVLMGRRGFGEMLAYSALVFFALASTVLPFFFNEYGSGLINFTPEGMVSGPLPGFDSLLFGSRLEEVWTIILGLLLSAGVPWLLVALFLKPKPPRLPDDNQQIAE